MFCSVYSVFIVPTGTLRLPWLSFFRWFSSVVGQMPGYISQKRGKAHNLPNYWILFFYVLFVSIVLFYVLFVFKCVLYCTTATGWQPKCSYIHYNFNIIKRAEDDRLIWSKSVADHSTVKCPFYPNTTQCWNVNLYADMRNACTVTCSIYCDLDQFNSQPV